MCVARQRSPNGDRGWRNTPVSGSVSAARKPRPSALTGNGLVGWTCLAPLADPRHPALQPAKDPRADDGPVLEQLAGAVVDLELLLTNFPETAAAASAMDLVITVDTAVAHMAGALGKPTWICCHISGLAVAPRTRRHAVPAVRLFRQPRPQGLGKCARSVAWRAGTFRSGRRAWALDLAAEQFERISRTSAWISRTRASSTEKFGASPARARRRAADPHQPLRAGFGTDT